MKAGEMAIHSLRTVHRSKGTKHFNVDLPLLFVFLQRKQLSMLPNAADHICCLKSFHWKHEKR